MNHRNGSSHRKKALLKYQCKWTRRKSRKIFKPLYLRTPLLILILISKLLVKLTKGHVGNVILTRNRHRGHFFKKKGKCTSFSFHISKEVDFEKCVRYKTIYFVHSSYLFETQRKSFKHMFTWRNMDEVKWLSPEKMASLTAGKKERPVTTEYL